MSRLKNILVLSALIIMAIAAMMGCRKDIINDDPSFKLEFSADTILFDTVFTTVGSVTLPLKVYNRSASTIIISSVVMAGGGNSNFRMNVDGVPGDEVSDVEIAAKDSIYILVEVTVDPNNANTPLIITDSIVFQTNGNLQDVQLVAWGQDAYFHYPDHFSPNLPPYSLLGGTWATDKPHVIYGYAVVDEDSTLIIPAGAKVHLHNSSVLWVYDGGSLKVQGTAADPVTFEGDRLEESYKDVPGQWGRIWLSAGSYDNIVDHAIIRNGSIGIHVDTLGNSNNPTLTLSNTLIENMSIAALYAQGSHVKAWNCVFTNCGQYAVVLAIGGNYDFRHCTIGNYWTYGVRQTPSLVLNNYYKDINNNIQIRGLDNAYFGNCIIHGSNAEEIALDSTTLGGTFNFQFENCLMKTERDVTSSSKYIACLNYLKPYTFIFKARDDLHLLDSNSPAIDIGNPTITGSIALDIDGNSRIVGSAPDAGAYEYAPTP